MRIDEPNQTPGVSGDLFSERLRGFGPVGILAVLIILAGNLVFVPLSALLVLAWAWGSRTPWAAIGFSPPQSWIGTLVSGIAFGVAFKCVMKAIVMPVLGAPDSNAAFHFLIGNSTALPGIMYAVVVGAGFGEEVFFRGYLFERFGRLFGSSPTAKGATVLLTAGLFGLAHYSLQGPAGVQQATIVGLVFGTIFAVTRRLWLLIVAHAAFDVTAVAIIYYDLEAKIAHLVFK